MRSMSGTRLSLSQCQVFRGQHKRFLKTSIAGLSVFISSVIETTSLLVGASSGQFSVAILVSSRSNYGLIMAPMENQPWQKHSAGIHFVLTFLIRRDLRYTLLPIIGRLELTSSAFVPFRK